MTAARADEAARIAAIAARCAPGEATLVARTDGAVVYRGGGGHVAIKLHHDAGLAAREAEVLRCLGAAGAARVPRLVAHEHEAVVMTWLAGLPALDVWPTWPHEGDERARFAHDAGALLARVQHAVPEAVLARASFWRGATAVAPGAGGLVWRDYLGGLVTKWRTRVAADEADTDLTAALGALARGVAQLPPPTRLTLLHCDFALRNLLVEAGAASAAGLIDFAAALVGDPLYDLAKLTWTDLGADEPRARAALVAGFAEGAAAHGAPVDEARLRLYEAIQGLAAVAWADRRGGHDPASPHAAFRAAGRRALLSILGLSPRSPC